jgi:hypothetical protein
MYQSLTRVEIVTLASLWRAQNRPINEQRSWCVAIGQLNSNFINFFSFEQAAIAALKQIEADKPVELRTDSHYVMKGTII